MLGIGGLVLALSIILSGLMAAPTKADAWWWPWWKNAYAQEDEHATSTVTVTIQKYIDGNQATASSSDSLSFPMSASWDNDGEGSGSYALNAGNSYQAMTSAMKKGADYSTHEVFGETAGASCEDGKPFALVGYTTGSTLAEAEAGTPATTSPTFTDLMNDAYVIVWNQSCGDDNPSAGELVGEVTGGSTDEEPGELAVTAIEAEKTTAVANGTFADGWRYVFKITVPSDEPDLAMKFNDWLHSNGSSTIPVANNMRISSDQADNSGATVLLTAADTYSSPSLTMTDDLDSEEDGLQVEVLVEVAVPAGTLNGTYSTDYGVRSE